jgi:hypothetical protein
MTDINGNPVHPVVDSQSGLGRIINLYKAVKASLPYTPGEIVAAGGEMVWDLIKFMLTVLFVSALVGAVIEGLPSGGAGAVSGAVGGMAAAMDALNKLGLGFLVVGATTALVKAGEQWFAGAKEAWYCDGSDTSIDAAGRKLAKGTGILVGFLVTMMVGYVLSNGLSSFLKGLDSSPMRMAEGPGTTMPVESAVEDTVIEQQGKVPSGGPCFTAGTRVYAISRGHIRAVPIETVSLGALVVSRDANTGEAISANSKQESVDSEQREFQSLFARRDPSDRVGKVGIYNIKAVDGENVDLKTWRVLELEMATPDGGKTEIKLLRPLWWVKQAGVTTGKSLAINMPQMHLSGTAKVLSERLVPSNAVLGDGAVTGTFKHSDDVLDLHLAGEPGTIGVTGPHLFRSADRNDWVPASALHIGEHVVTRRGTTTVVAVEHRSTRAPVYNLEVHGSHTYFVGTVGGGVWVHNDYVVPEGGPYYRGGADITNVRPNVDVKVSNGLVQPTHGMSLENTPQGLDRFGGAYKVEMIPDELRIIQRGNRATHYEIVPKEPMPLEKFEELLKQVKLSSPG